MKAWSCYRNERGIQFKVSGEGEGQYQNCEKRIARAAPGTGGVKGPALTGYSTQGGYYEQAA